MAFFSFGGSVSVDVFVLPAFASFHFFLVSLVPYLFFLI